MELAVFPNDARIGSHVVSTCTENSILDFQQHSLACRCQRQLATFGNGNQLVGMSLEFDPMPVFLTQETVGDRRLCFGRLSSNPKDLVQEVTQIKLFVAGSDII